MRTIFFVAYEFPPLNMGGEQRPVKFVKYLKQFGVNPVVFSLDAASYPAVFGSYNADPETMGQIPDDIDVVRVPSDDIVSLRRGKVRAFIDTWFSILPRQGEGWKRHFESAFAQQYAKQRPELLLVTAPPFSMLPLCVDIAQRFNLPLIIDMRDAWSAWNMTPYGSYLHYKLTLALERTCLSAAKAVIATSDQTLDDFKRLHPMIPSETFQLINNGYDRNIDDWIIHKTNLNEAIFTIGYVGSFYYSPEGRKQMFTPWWRKRGHRMLQYVPQHEDWLYRTPYFFFSALRVALNDNPVLEQQIHVKFAGKKPEWFDTMVSEFALESVVRHLGVLSHRDSLAFQQSCDALLVTSSKVIDGQDYSIAGKTYEYISMKKPIIGFVAEGAQKRILERSGLAVVCEPDMPDKSSRQLADLVGGKWNADPNIEFLNSLHRKELTKKLAEVIHSVLDDRNI